MHAWLSPGVVPVVVVSDAAEARPLAEALVAGGLPVAEVTFRTAAAADAIAAMRDVPGLTVGAGTVISPQQVQLAREAGAEFVVSPGFSAPVVEAARAAGLDVLPGVATASDIMAALAAGCDVLKFFPAEAAGGVAALKALAAPFVAARFVPTGGVGPANLADYLALPSVLAVGGSWMVPADAIRDHDWERITRLAREAVAAVAAAKEHR